jgi:hypothetical protein
LFNWFVELFDYKVIPNVPGDPSIKPYHPRWTGPQYNKWYTRPMQDHSFMDIAKYKDLYKNPFNLNIEITPWYRDWSTLFWVVGGICTIGIGYICYQSYYDPMYIVKQIWGPVIRETGPTPPEIQRIPLNPTVRRPPTGPLDPGPSTSVVGMVTGSIASGASAVTKGLVSGYKYTLHKLNPLNWTMTAAEREAA